MKVLVLILTGLFGLAACNGDENEIVSDEVRSQVRSEWDEMGPLAQEMICNIWNDPNRNELIAAFGAMDESNNEESSPAELEAGLEIMEEECN